MINYEIIKLQNSIFLVFGFNSSFYYSCVFMIIILDTFLNFGILANENIYYCVSDLLDFCYFFYNLLFDIQEIFQIYNNNFSSLY